MTQTGEPTSPATLVIIKDGGWTRFLATFASGDQAITWLEAKRAESMAATGTIYSGIWGEEDEAYPLAPVGPVTPDQERLLDYLYPRCEHGMDAQSCMGPDHFMDRQQEIAAFGY
jgi:hypothetical protein